MFMKTKFILGVLVCGISAEVTRNATQLDHAPRPQQKLMRPALIEGGFGHHSSGIGVDDLLSQSRLEENGEDIIIELDQTPTFTIARRDHVNTHSSQSQEGPTSSNIM
jgi:hypothetical protein